MSDWYNGAGYWVSPEGKIHPLRHSQEHETTAEKILETLPPSDADLVWCYGELTARGWIAIGISPYTAEVSLAISEFASLAQRSAVRTIFKEHGRGGSELFVLEGGVHAMHNNVREAIAALNQIDFAELKDGS